jgi:site-specific DNA recombinase
MTATLTEASLAAAAVRALTGREYLRVSFQDGTSQSTTEQHDDNVSGAAREGIALGVPYVDDGASASDYGTKVREGFGQLMEDLRTGAFGADILVLWESSRGSRSVGEWVDLIELLKARRVRIYVTTHGRTYDPNNARDERSLLEDAVDSQYESRKISGRVRRNKASRAAAGAPAGRTPIGYVRLYDPVTRKHTAQVPDDSPLIPDEVRPAVLMAPRIRDMFAALRRGESLKSIAREWEAAGIVSPVRTTRKGAVVGGKLYTAQHLRSMAFTYSYAGLRVHVPHGTSGTSSRRPSPDQIFEGSWEPIVDRETFYAVQEILNDPSRRTSRPGRANHLLTMTARCDVCGSVLTFRTERGGELACRASGHVRLPKSAGDAHATALMLNVLSDDDLGGLMAERGSDMSELRELRAEIKALAERYDALADNVDIPEELLARRAKALKASLTTARERERELATPDALRGLIMPGAGVAERWELLTMETKRQVARILFSPAVLGYLTVTREPFRGADAVDRIKLRKVAPEAWTNGPKGAEQ